MGDEAAIHELAAEGVRRGGGDDGLIQVEESGHARCAWGRDGVFGHGEKPAGSVLFTLFIVAFVGNLGYCEEEFCSTCCHPCQPVS